MDKETAYQVVMDENRRLSALVAALTSSSPPLPPPLPAPEHFAAELEVNAYLSGAAPAGFILVSPEVLAGAVPWQRAESYLAPKRPRRAYGDTGIATVMPVAASVATGAAMPLIQAVEAMLRAHTLDWAPTQR